MRRMYIGDLYQIQCYKHDGKVHRFWDEAILLDIKKDYLVFGNNKTTVIDSDGSIRKTKEPAILYFFKDNWYNIISQIKKDGIYYYCNIATPFIIEEGTIKYIDYDLDLRVFPSGYFKVLDRLEYEYHKKRMKYPKKLDIVVNNALKDLIDIYCAKAVMFDRNANLKYVSDYFKLKNN